MAAPWISQVARSTPFDNASNGFPSSNTDVQQALENVKSGLVPTASFSGNPKKATVTFTQPFPAAIGTNYAIVIEADNNGRNWTYESKTVNGFVISANANAALTAGEISWHAIAVQG